LRQLYPTIVVCHLVTEEDTHEIWERGLTAQTNVFRKLGAMVVARAMQFCSTAAVIGVIVLPDAMCLILFMSLVTYIVFISMENALEVQRFHEYVLREVQRDLQHAHLHPCLLPKLDRTKKIALSRRLNSLDVRLIPIMGKP